MSEPSNLDYLFAVIEAAAANPDRAARGGQPEEITLRVAKYGEAQGDLFAVPVQWQACVNMRDRRKARIAAVAPTATEALRQALTRALGALPAPGATPAPSTKDGPSTGRSRPASPEAKRVEAAAPEAVKETVRVRKRVRPGT